jgi:cytochrome P450
VPVKAPEPVNHNPLLRIGVDVLSEARSAGGYPPGASDFSLARTSRFMDDPLAVLLPCYERHGPIFSLRIFHERFVFMLGPQANHYVLVENAQNFSWREGDFGQLIPLLGDGLLTIDGEYHRRARRIMLPAFHHESIAAALATMLAEAERALTPWRDGAVVDVYRWARVLAMRIAMRALLGLDPDDGDRGARAARHFERALSYYGTGPFERMLRGPGSAWRRMTGSRGVLDEIIYGEIVRRRRQAGGDRGRRRAGGDGGIQYPGGGGRQDLDAGGRQDILGLLMAAHDEDGARLSDHEIRDQMMTLAFAGHDTSTSTIAFMLYELARHPDALERVSAERDRVVGAAPPTPAQLAGELPELEQALDETLRLYPPAWIGPRRALDAFEFAGHRVPAGAYVAYSSWASHRLPDVFDDPDDFRPERFTPGRKAQLPKGAYVPFGGGSRTCIGMRFGKMEIKAVIAELLRRYRPETFAGTTMKVRHSPTLGPKNGLRLVMRARRPR